ncbi:MAG: energy-coupling factor ABC transporter ATP-binding protein [Candidatus Kariarchaeaceae archaeon]
MHHLEFIKVNFSYPTFQLKDISFSVENGEILALVGRNGAGKSTILRLMVGLEKPKSGEIIVHGLKMTKKLLPEIRRKIGFLFQNPDSQVFSPTAFEDVAFGPRNIGLAEEDVKTIVERSLRQVEMSEYVNHSPFELSQGQRKRVALAGLLAMEPDVIIMDEPFANLDYPTANKLQKTMQKACEEKNVTIVFTSHDRRKIENWADKIVFLERGEIVFQGRSSELANFELTQEVLGP